ncbi:peptidase M14 [Massilia sp. Root133]|uniref:M14 family metallopeptidase n=1 Tax=unclassified Massilia TaxID=2609279 RepID=UPI0006FDB945|nr:MULTISPECIES: M14 family metallopeptidase [unclassified Massilia]KQY00333.1 peptidase M14 [Massilia sp. Root133]KQZ38958.1 peptidase M14 [Massilia sp. Root1485]
MIRIAFLLALLAAPLAHAAPDLVTVSERSGFQATGRYDEVVKLCGAFQQAYPKQVKCFQFGTTPEGRPMLALAVNARGVFTPEAARKANLPVTLIQGGIHAGEIDGKDAGFLALREILDGKVAAGVLDRQVLLFVPVFNVDGHERFAKWNRPNQRGPVEMGWRTTAQNTNLNRDYVKADAPEMQAMLALVNAWDPLTYVDLHVTDGAMFQHDVSIQVEPVYSGDPEFREIGRALRANVIADISKQGSMPQSYYMSFKETDDPASGFVDGVSDPRFSTGYFQLRNRMAMLVETHSWKDYPTRVRITHNAIVSVLQQVAAHGAAWTQAARAADARATHIAGQPVALTYRTTDKTTMVDFQGYAYTRTMSDVSGMLMTHYDETKPQVWHVPLRDEVVADLQVRAPGAGYVVPAAWAQMVATKLVQHGIVFRKIDKAVDAAPVQTFRADQATFSPTSFESHQRLKVEGSWKPEPRNLGKGALFVPIAQPKARLVMALFEPQAPDSLLAWGEFNNAFERKEYMEEYVAEDVAREQMARDPALAAEFRRKVETDPAFAKNAHARLEFFARRHPSWDERFNLYPVLRTDVAL